MDNLAGATSSKKNDFPLSAAISDQRLLGLEWDLVPTASLHAQLPQAPGNGSLSPSAAATARFSKVSLVAAQMQVLPFLALPREDAQAHTVLVPSAHKTQGCVSSPPLPALLILEAPKLPLVIF